RSIISGNYPVTAASNDHSQGLFHSGEGQPPHVSVLIQECVFDHNGWRLPVSAENDGKVGVATIKNHNTYFENTRGVLFDSNMFLRGSSMGTKWTANSGPNSSSN